MKKTITIKIPSFRDTIKRTWDNIELNFPSGCSFAVMHKYAIEEKWKITYHRSKDKAIKTLVKHQAHRLLFDSKGYHIIKNNTENGAVWDRDECYALQHSIR